jgi:triphosphatase
MTEVELKFQVPPASRAAVQRAVATAAAATTRLRAQYLDTPDRRLAAAGVALRLRLEGRTWVQTAKAAGPGLATRLEHEVRLPRQAGVPTVDISRHDEAPALAGVLRAALQGAAPLQVVFETDVRRTHRVLRSAGAAVELALDQGHIAAAGQRVPVWEIEFELLRGELPALLALAGRWVQRHGLWLDPRTKSERGHRLALGDAVSPPSGARPPALRATHTLDQGLRHMVGAALAQALPNAAVLADGQGSPEHLHQLRVGLRRLRCALRLFAGTGADPAWPAALAQLFGRLGASRDLDVWAATLQPALVQAGAPAPRRAAPDATDAPSAALREPATNQLWLQLLAYADTPGTPLPGDTALRPLAAQQLLRLHRRLRRAAAGFDTLDAEGRHRLRRQIKRLRYGAEATAALWPAKALRRYLDALRPMQDELGACNDVQVALARARAQPDPDAAAWFARGWLAARHDHLQERAAAALRGWPKPPRAWRPDKR